MGILTHALKQSADILTTTRSKWGDQIFDTLMTVACRFRYITQISQSANAEAIDSSDAIIWFELDAPIEEGTIIGTEGEYWRINRLVRARKLRTADIHFLKAFVTKHQIIVES